MSALLFVALMVFGFAYIAGWSVISFPLRSLTHDHLGLPGRLLVELLECPMCVSTWLGFAVGWEHPGIVPILYASKLESSFATGLFCAGSSWIIARATGLVTAPIRQAQPIHDQEETT